MAPISTSRVDLEASSTPHTSTATATPTTHTYTYTGSCLCGSITLTLISPYDIYTKPTGHLCHCANCRKNTGAPGGLSVLMVPTSSVTIHDPKEVLHTYYDSSTKSGRTVPRSFCLECGTPIGCVPSGLDEKLSIIGLTLFGEVPEVEFECFTSSRVPWVKPVAPEDKQYLYIEEVAKHMPALE